MKPFLTKTMDLIGFGSLRRRPSTAMSVNGSGTLGNHVISQSVPASSFLPVPVEERVEIGEVGSWSIYHTSPSLDFMENSEDDVLFRKNNVYLKHSTKTNESLLSSYSSSEGSLMESLSYSKSLSEATPIDTPTSAPVSIDQVELVPGYMQISTRGTDFGQTLILNWISNYHLANHSSVPLDRGASSAAKPRPHSPHSPVSIDLGEMETIRVFYQLADQLISSGEVVIINKERKFHIFYFKHGGLYELIKKFCLWKYFNYKHHRQLNQYIFSIFKPKLTLSELHEEEGLVNGVLTQSMWKQLQDPAGRVLDKKTVLQTIFFRGMEPSLRMEVWPCLLGIVEFDWTTKMKREKFTERHTTYHHINKKRESMMSTGRHSMEQSMLQQIRNDIKRTDRSHPFYKGENNDNIQRLEFIILNYFVAYRTDITYCQGMTDILAPVLMCLNDDADAFFCFTKLVERTPFFQKAGKRVTLIRQVTLLKNLIQLLLPLFYSYLCEIDDGLSLLFAHRWILVGLKREFKMDDTLLLWETCWTNYITNSFPLFIMVAIIAIYGQKAVDEDMSINELTIHFNGLANCIPINVVLPQARGYLYQFTKLPQIPCVLRHIMPDDYWENTGKTPFIKCDGTGSCCKGCE